MRLIVNDNGTDRPMTEQEIATYEIAASRASAEQQAIADAFAAQQAAKESARAKLAALGLTEEEIAALIG
jgi:DnaJ-domain-containing protein 1